MICRQHTLKLLTVVAGQVAKVNFNNKLKRGDLQVVKSSEDNLVEGVKFHLYGTSLSGDAVDQYAVTDNNGVATFKDVLISGCNDEQFLKTENPEVLLPHFSCHSLRHTFTTRMCEAGVNIKVIQDTLGHKDITTTLNIYTDVTKELKKTEFEGLDKYFDNSIA